MTPALALYELLFDAAPRRPAKETPSTTAVEVAGWLGPLGELAAEVMIAGTRLPHEAVGYELLSAESEVLNRI
ncbi:hypothetical protein [Kribbella flavida]|uniref:hypothetical protein n=1 Tax=Kribbella flavida TaxID=182640 RepID=UPI0011D245CF|nr:hypothetical protein [Kribbella flavida]